MATTAVKMQKSKNALTDKQCRFCEEYLVDLNATQAAIRAGFSPQSARVSGYRALTNANIQAEIQKRRAERTERPDGFISDFKNTCRRFNSTRMISILQARLLTYDI